MFNILSILFFLPLFKYYLYTPSPVTCLTLFLCSLLFLYLSSVSFETPSVNPYQPDGVVIFHLVFILIVFTCIIVLQSYKINLSSLLHLGHEFPFAIQMSQYREVSIVDDDDYVPSSPDSPPVHNTPSIEITPENQLQFILQKGRKVHQKGKKALLRLICVQLCPTVFLINVLFLYSQP